MKLTEIDVHSITESAWNPNQMDQEARDRLLASIKKFEVVQPLVVRKIGPDRYETIGGAQRLSVIKELGMRTVDCIVVTANDAEARLLTQALNRIEGTDDPVKLQASIDLIFENIPQGEVLELLPDAANSIGKALAFDVPSLLDHLKNFEDSRKARLSHFSAQFTNDQQPIIDQAISHARKNGAFDETNPNKRGNALFHICQTYLSQLKSL
ncbi:ParB N-terminal domain-containing protein [Dehalococcoides mccartyi]|nr:ParB N-terminal domain-containing protein [Dehalococcoides mccartyi]